MLVAIRFLEVRGQRSGGSSGRISVIIGNDFPLPHLMMTMIIIIIIIIIIIMWRVGTVVLKN
jgi:hypothetical protein